MKAITKLNLGGLIAIALNACCHFEPQAIDVRVPQAPEDIALSQNKQGASILASCRMLQKGTGKNGAIVRIDPVSGSTTEVYHHPLKEGFHPQGISLAKDGSELLVVNHHEEKHASILRLSLAANGSFRLKERIPVRTQNNRELGKPNDVAALPNGDILLTVPCHLNSRKDRILRYSQRVKRWLNFDPNPEGKMPNGIWIHEDGAYVSFSKSNDVYRYDWTSQELSRERVFCGIQGGDNFGAIAGEPNKVLLSSHQSLVAFILNKSLPRLCAPMRIWELDLEADKKNEVLPTGGKRFRVNSGSVAVKTEKDLFIGQVYETYVVRVPAHAFTTDN